MLVHTYSDRRFLHAKEIKLHHDIQIHDVEKIDQFHIFHAFLASKAFPPQLTCESYESIQLFIIRRYPIWSKHTIFVVDKTPFIQCSVHLYGQNKTYIMILQRELSNYIVYGMMCAYFLKQLALFLLTSGGVKISRWNNRNRHHGQWQFWSGLRMKAQKNLPCIANNLCGQTFGIVCYIIY